MGLIALLMLVAVTVGGTGLGEMATGTLLTPWRVGTSRGPAVLSGLGPRCGLLLGAAGLRAAMLTLAASMIRAAGAGISCSGLASVALTLLRESILESTNHRGLDSGGCGLDELAHVLQFRQNSLAVYAKFLGQLIHACFGHLLSPYRTAHMTGAITLS